MFTYDLDASTEPFHKTVCPVLKAVRNCVVHMLHTNMHMDSTEWYIHSILCRFCWWTLSSLCALGSGDWYFWSRGPTAWIVMTLKLVTTPTWHCFQLRHNCHLTIYNNARWLGIVCYEWHTVLVYWIQLLTLKRGCGSAVHNSYKLQNYLCGLNGNVENFDVVLVTTDNLKSKEKRVGLFFNLKIC